MHRWICTALLVLMGCSSPATSRDSSLPANGDGTVASSDNPDAATTTDDSGPLMEDDGGSASPIDSGTVDCATCPSSRQEASIFSDTTEWRTNLQRTRHNALKGFITAYQWGNPVSDFPDQMEFLYVPMRDVWNASGATLDAGLEPRLVAAAARNHHVVLRVFIDYPSQPSGLPPHLATAGGCTTYTAHGGGCSPNYDAPDLVNAMQNLIEALGRRYDGDPRLGFIQLGLLGFWGEWHTWPHPERFASEATQRIILDAYEAAFTRTQLQVRRPALDSVRRRFGFHDDSFAYSTLGDIAWFFLPSLEMAGGATRWHEVAIGGELRPELQARIFREDYVTGDYAQDIEDCIEQTHATYLLNYYAFNGDGRGYTPTDRERAETAALGMGYRFELTAASVRLSNLDGDGVDVSLSLEIRQGGVAPFYYPLFVRINHRILAESVVSATDLQNLLPDETRNIVINLGHLPALALQNPFEIDFTSPMLSSAQQVRLATETPWTDSDSPTRVQWTVVCTHEGRTYPLGQTVAFADTPCDCRCDVDGTIRSCDGSICGG